MGSGLCALGQTHEEQLLAAEEKLGEAAAKHEAEATRTRARLNQLFLERETERARQRQRISSGRTSDSEKRIMMQRARELEAQIHRTEQLAQTQARSARAIGTVQTHVSRQASTAGLHDLMHLVSKSLPSTRQYARQERVLERFALALENSAENEASLGEIFDSVANGNLEAAVTDAQSEQLQEERQEQADEIIGENSSMEAYFADLMKDTGARGATAAEDELPRFARSETADVMRPLPRVPAVADLSVLDSMPDAPRNRGPASDEFDSLLLA